ncbi:PPOX1 [Symbiodinium necroappetens]|uniref:PPOX1 protein n=1 Tax=Symbiodinium necroappetens TaxID=1628268 RepID=A0A812M8N1_9DINO|nr:PPOX1 [Symbiodinium necroappetens]
MESAADQLTSWDTNTRKFSLQTLGLCGPSADVYSDQVAKCLDDEEAAVRKAAAVALGKMRASSETSALLAALRDTDAEVRCEAARALGQVSAKVVSPHVSKVVALHQDADEEVGLAAVSCLVAVGQARVLAPFTSSTFPTVAKAAIMEIGRCPMARTANAGCLSRALSHKDTAVRMAAAQACGELGAECAEEHLRALASASADRHVKVRRAAVQALGRLGSLAADYLVRFFRDPDDSLRHFAAETMGGLDDALAAEVTAKSLTEAQATSTQRQSALQALGKMKAGRDHAAAVAACLDDADLATRLAAIQALSGLKSEDYAPRLEQLRKDPAAGVRIAAVSALAKMGERGASSALIFLEDEDAGVRQSAVKVFSPLHSKLPSSVARAHIHQVAQLLLDEDWHVRLAVVVALGDLHMDIFSEQVAALSQDENNQVRRSAVAALEKMKASPAHAARFLGDDDPAVRSHAEEVYASLGGGRPDEDGDISEATHRDTVQTMLHPTEANNLPAALGVRVWDRAIPQLEIGHNKRLADVKESLADAGVKGILATVAGLIHYLACLERALARSGSAQAFCMLPRIRRSWHRARDGCMLTTQ